MVQEHAYKVSDMKSKPNVQLRQEQVTAMKRYERKTRQRNVILYQNRTQTINIKTKNGLKYKRNDVIQLKT